MSLKICAMSDLHGVLYPIEEIEPHEVTLICGDISPLKIQANHKKARQWFLKEFKPWCESLPSKKVYFIAGNHDIMLFNDPDFMYTNFSLSNKVTYLNSSGDVYSAVDGETYKIYGTPWCKQFGNWAFMTNDEELRKIYSSIPDNLDILLTHDQPYGYGDILLEEMIWNTKEHIGNKELYEAVLRTQPNYMFVGHLHSTDHECVQIQKTKRYNVSIMSERYEPIYFPRYLEIDKI